MTWTTIAAIYFVLWWIVLFAILPWGVRSQHEHDGEVVPGTDPGAPVLPQLRKKVIWTTIVTTVVFVAVYYAYLQRWITVEKLTKLFGTQF
jgi:predicted secreted protein